MTQRLPRDAAQALFFPAAAAYAAIVAPLSVYGVVTHRRLVPGLSNPAGHAHELLFGFALAVVAGFLINRTTPLRLYGLFALWIAARLSFLSTPAGPVAALCNAAFAIALLALVVPAFMKAAKKWRNRAIGPILITVGLALVIFHAAAASAAPAGEYRALYLGVLALTLLMLFMGGRVIAPAAAGQIRIQGGHLEARVQPRLEGTLLVLMGAAAALLPSQPTRILAGYVLLAAAIVTLIRLARWRLWQCADRHDLWCLGIGYAWLGLGLALLGAALLFGVPAAAAAVHALTVGAFGTLTLTMMSRTRMLAVKRPAGSMPGLRAAVALIAGAAVLRIANPHQPQLLIAASLLWSAGFLILLVTLLRYRRAGARAESTRG